LGALALCGLGFAVFWTAPWAWLAFLGLAVTGLGISLHFPLGISLAIAAADGATDLATARASYAAGLAVGVAPLALGALADRVGVHLAFLLVPVLLVIAAAGVRRAHPAQVTPSVAAG
ncbi:MAG: MFS transporter, partial [Actinomycetota bacterium]